MGGPVASRRDLACSWAIGFVAGWVRWVEFIAFSLFVLQVTGSALAVATLSALRMLPYLLVAPFAGALADAGNRKILLLLGLAALSAGCIAAAWIVSEHQWAFVPLAILSMASGAFWVGDLPVRRFLLAEAAGERRIAASAFDAGTSYLVRACGILTGGIALTYLSMGKLLLLNGVSYFACFLLAIALRPIRRYKENAWARWSFSALLPPAPLFKNRAYLALLAIAGLYNLCCLPLTAMVPVLAGQQLQFTPLQVSSLAACEAAGAMIGAGLVALRANDRLLFRFHYAGLLIFVGAMLLVPLHLHVRGVGSLLLLAGVGTGFYMSTQYI
jgi:MFS family permease